MSKYGKIKGCYRGTKKYAVDAMIVLVVEELAFDLKLNPTLLLKEFVELKTGILLYDELSKLWWNGPSYIADLYKSERINETKMR